MRGSPSLRRISCSISSSVYARPPIRPASRFHTGRSSEPRSRMLATGSLRTTSRWRARCRRRSRRRGARRGSRAARVARGEARDERAPVGRAAQRRVVHAHAGGVGHRARVRREQARVERAIERRGRRGERAWPRAARPRSASGLRARRRAARRASARRPTTSRICSSLSAPPQGAIIGDFPTAAPPSLITLNRCSFESAFM